MISLHSVKPAIPYELARAAAMLHRDYTQITRFRITGEQYTAQRGDWGHPLEYFYQGLWHGWTNDSLEGYLSGRYHRDPTEEQVEAAYAMFEEKA